MATKFIAPPNGVPKPPSPAPQTIAINIHDLILLCDNFAVDFFAVINH